MSRLPGLETARRMRDAGATWYEIGQRFGRSKEWARTTFATRLGDALVVRRRRDATLGGRDIRQALERLRRGSDAGV